MPHTAQEIEPLSRLLAKLLRTLLARDAFDTLADLTAALKTECARLKIRWTPDAISDAYALLASNRPLVRVPPPRPRGERLDAVRPLSRAEAADLCARLGVALGRAPAPVRGGRMTTPIQVYLAAPYPERAAAQRVGQALEHAGLEVTATWLREDDAPSDASARRDLADLARADVLVALNPAAWADRGTGGRHVEFGYALAWGKPIVLVGVRSHVFHELSRVTVVADDHDLAAQVTQAHAAAAGSR